MPLSEELEERLDRFNGTNTTIVMCIMAILKRSDKKTREAVTEAMDEIISTEEDTAGADAARILATAIKRGLTGGPFFPST